MEEVRNKKCNGILRNVIQQQYLPRYKTTQYQGNARSKVVNGHVQA
jgi:hypothetical protein